MEVAEGVEGVEGEEKQKEEEEFEEENEVLQTYLRIKKKIFYFFTYSLFDAFLFLGNSFLPEQLREIQTYFCLGEQNSK